MATLLAPTQPATRSIQMEVAARICLMQVFHNLVRYSDKEAKGQACSTVNPTARDKSWLFTSGSLGHFPTYRSSADVGFWIFEIPSLEFASLHRIQRPALILPLGFHPSLPLVKSLGDFGDGLHLENPIGKRVDGVDDTVQVAVFDVRGLFRQGHRPRFSAFLENRMPFPPAPGNP